MNKKRVFILLIAILLLTGCTAKIDIQLAEHAATNRNYYQIFTGSFYDSDGDGIGDLQGIVHQLDYLNNPTGRDTLGVQGIWLTPIHPSPTYHKYDVLDYYSIDPDFGTMEDFELLISEANKRGIDVIIDLVINHTSSQHPWFLAALDEIKSDSEPFYRDFYNFVEERPGSGYYQTVGGLFYEAHFWSEMPDLNMDNEHLRAEIANIAKFWLDKGVAGFRLDAVMHIYRSEAKNLEFWTWFVDMCREVKEDVFLVGEVWANEAVIMPYFETGLALFNFPFANHDGIINATLRSANGQKLAAEIERWAGEIYKRNPDGINCMFLSNHDTGRSAGFITDPDKRKLAAAIYLMLPGNPFIYYGEEIGMAGSGIDENKRSAMFWSASDSTGIARNPIGSTNDRTPEQGVAEQFDDPDSLLSYYRQILALKSKYPDIFDGEVKAIDVNNSSICAIQTGDVVVMHNLTDESIEVVIPNGVSQLGGFVSPSGAAATASGNVVTIPPYGTVVLS